MRKVALLLLVSLTAFAQQPVHVEPPVFVTAIDVVADVRDASGKLPAGLTPADFILLEDGVEKKVIGVDYLRAERTAEAAPGAPPASKRMWQLVLYFETQLSNGTGRKQAAEELMKQVDTMVQMGTVDVVLADPTPRPLVQSSRDPEAIRKALGTVASNIGVNQLAAHRRDFVRETQSSTQLGALRQNSPLPPVIEDPGSGGRGSRRTIRTPPPIDLDQGGGTPAPNLVNANVVRPYIEREVHMINRFRTNLMTWLSNYRRYSPRTLVMVTDGFDLDPLQFYAPNLARNDELTLRSYVTQAALGESSQKLARALASAGWATVSIPSDNNADGWLDDASSSSIGRVHKNTTGPAQKGPRAFLYRPLEPLDEAAEVTGGAVVTNSSKIAAAIESLDDRLRVTYQVDRKPDGKARKIELRPRNNQLKVRGARWASASTPDEMAEQRALGQLKEATYTGDLPVEANVDWTMTSSRKAGTLRVVARTDSLTKLLTTPRGDFRLTLAAQIPPNQAFVTNHQIPSYNLADGTFRLRTPLDLPAGTSVVVVAIEETNTGMWGSARIEVP
jgi:VWFA-related protein